MRSLLAALLIALTVPVGAATVTLTAVQDASVFSGVPGSDTLADSQGPFLWLSTTAEGLTRRALVRFDVSTVPPGSVVQSARLVLFETRSRTNHLVSLHRVQQAWSEGTSNAGSQGAGAPAQAGDPTWTHRVFSAQPWATPGGNPMPTASAQTLVGLPNQTHSWGSTAAMVADVQGWVNQPEANHGWVLIGDEVTIQSAKQFQSRADGAVPNAQPPVLELTFEPPPLQTDADVPVPGWALALLGLVLTVLMRDRVMTSSS